MPAKTSWLGRAVSALVVCLFLVSAASAVSIATVPVGNPGNAPDTEHDGCGAVDYPYNIGTYEVTASQYAEFLNAVAATDTYGLYNTSMGSSSDAGCQITRNGTSGSYTYDFSGCHVGNEADWANRPVNYISWGDAARFANWLHNGQPTGAQDLTTTEDGAYYLNGATGEADLLAVTREADCKWAIPTEDEWYKAAYHKNDGVTGNYWDFPTRADVGPSNDLIDPDPGNNATFGWPESTIGSPYYRTEVGEHENSDSPYGTFDQGGNVFEWNEAISPESFRGLRGGGYGSTIAFLSTLPYYYCLTYEYRSFGFRVSEVPVLGDANFDRKVDSADLALWQAHYDPLGANENTFAMGDWDGNGLIDSADLALWQQNYDPIGHTPEPATLVLLVLGGLVVLMRRRKRSWGD